MKHQSFIVGLVIAAASLSAVAALAQGPGGKGPYNVSFQTLDADGNGEITQDEMEQHRADRFTSADTDGDSVLSRDELVAASQKRAEERVDHMLERFDANGDGALAVDEMPKPRRAGKMFGRMDSDSSGGISEAEFDEARAHLKERMKGHGKGRMKHGSEQN